MTIARLIFLFFPLSVMPMLGLAGTAHPGSSEIYGVDKTTKRMNDIYTPCELQELMKLASRIFPIVLLNLPELLMTSDEGIRRHTIPQLKLRFAKQ